MISPLRHSLLLLLCATPLVAAAAPPPPAAAASAAAQPGPGPGPGEKPISIEFRGNLRDALKQIAQKGGLNLVVTGELSRDAEVYLKDVSAADALRTVAQAYHLHVEQSGSIWTLRPMTPNELSSPSAPEAPAAAPAPAAPAAAPAPAAPAAAVPPLPPPPEIKAGMSDEEIEQAMRQAEQIASHAEDEADRAIERAQQQADALRQAGSDRAEAMRQAAEQMRERAQEMKERAQAAREQAQEAREQAREALRSAKRVMKQRVGFSGPVTVKENEVVDDAVAYGSELTVLGHVKGDAVSFGGDVNLGPKAWVEGDVVSFGGTIHRDENAIVEGDVQAMGGAVIGKAVKEGLKETSHSSKSESHGDSGHPVATSLAWFVVLFGVGFVANLAVPQRMRLVHDEIRRNPVKSGVAGLLASLALVPLTILLCVTLIGIPIAVLILWPVSLLAWGVGLAVVASELGLRIPLFRGRKTQALVLAVGLLFIVVAMQIPVLGPITVAILGLIGFGAIVRTRFGGRNLPPAPLSDADVPTAAPV